MSRVVLLVLLVMAAVSGGCGGSLTAPDAGGQLGGIGGTGAGGSGAGGWGGAGAAIFDVRPADEPCSLQALATTAVAGETCRFYLPTPPCDYADNSHIEVRVGDAPIPRDPGGENGWDYSDATFTMITIYGPSCDAVTAGGGVTIVYRIILP